MITLFRKDDIAAALEKFIPRENPFPVDQYPIAYAEMGTIFGAPAKITYAGFPIREADNIDLINLISIAEVNEDGDYDDI